MTATPVVVDFPLRGEWVAYHTPADRVPSHGTDQLGQRYAYDFLRIDREREGWKYCRAPAWRYHLVGVPLSDSFGWGAPIHAPFSGTVVVAEDGWPERRLHFVRDLAVVLKNALTFDITRPNALRSVIGNYVVMQMPGTNIHALIAHARTGSVRVRVGAEVSVGDHVADVGHSGNSTAPHLHFQLMEGLPALDAVGVPCAFSDYEALGDGVWTRVAEGIPAKREFVRR
jgi:hypothetical protein